MTVNSVDLDIFDALVERLLRRSKPLANETIRDTEPERAPAAPRERS